MKTTRIQAWAMVTRTQLKLVNITKMSGTKPSHCPLFYPTDSDQQE